MSEFDAQRFAGALNQSYVQFVPSWAAPLSRNGRSVCSIDIRSAPTFFAVCNTTDIRVAFSATDNPQIVAWRLWEKVQQTC